MPQFFTGRRRWLFALLLALSFAQVGFGVAAAGAVSSLFAALSSPATTSNLGWAELLAAITAIALTEFGRRWTTEALGLDYAHQVRMVLFERLLRRPYRGGSSRSRGNVLLPFVGDLTALRQWWADGVARGSSSALIALGLCLYLGWANPMLGLALAAMVAAALVLIALFASPYARATRDQRRERGVLTGLISDRISAAHTVLALGGLQRELRQVDRRIGRMNRAALRRARWSGAMRAVAASAHLAGTLAVLLVASVLAASGTMAMHHIVGTLTLTGLLGGCIGDLVRACELAIPASISRERITARLDEVEPLRMKRAVAAKADAGSAPLRIRGLKLAAGAAPFSATARDGDVIAVDGEPGAGKSTLLAAIAGFQPVHSGLVLTLGCAAARLPQAFRRDALGYAGAAAPLVQGTLAANLLYRLRGSIDHSHIATLMHAAGLAHRLDASGAIARMAIRDGGERLPGAEVQAIQIVRAMAGSPQVLVLDDVFGALGDENLDQLVRLIRDWCGVVIMAGARGPLRALANRHWQVATSGITENTPSASVLPLAPRHKA